eukprot:scaffold3082_cov287-Chaetoceros_neogracile.AAC.17
MLDLLWFVLLCKMENGNVTTLKVSEIKLRYFLVFLRVASCERGVACCVVRARLSLARLQYFQHFTATADSSAAAAASLHPFCSYQVSQLSQ